MPPRLTVRSLARIYVPLLRPQCRGFTVLGIETSCDDTCVALIDADSRKILHNSSITSGNRAFGGVYPLHAIESHRMHLSGLLRECISQFPPPNLIAVTRGPGMFAQLGVGLDTAKGLAAAWNVPLIGVHHMQSHLLTPRLLDGTPEFPFWTLLVSGGHTMLVKSSGVTEHAVVSTTADIALGDLLDKAARTILPAPLIAQQESDVICYGRLLEDFCFPPGTPYPSTADAEFVLRAPFTTHGRDPAAVMSFSGLGTQVERAAPALATDAGRRALGRGLMRTAFGHVAGRVRRHGVTRVVVSGGVAANGFLRHVLGEGGVQVVAPPPRWCTDNAAMVAWAGFEMWRDGWRSDDTILPIKTWSLDSRVLMDGGGEGRGGILGVPGWRRREGFPEWERGDGGVQEEIEERLKGQPGMQTQLVRA